MSTFLKLLPLELQDVKEYHEPEGELGSNDHIVGEASEDIRKLFTYGKNLQKRYVTLEMEMKLTDNLSKRGELETQHQEFQAKARVISQLFWIAVRDEFSLWDKPDVGIRQGYQVVWIDEEQKPPTPGTSLKDLLGL